MKKKIIYITVAAVAALSSCSSEEFAGGNSGDGMVFTGTIDNEAITSRSTLGTDYKVSWENTDKVSINGATYTVAPSSEDDTKATFTLESGQTTPSGDTYKSLYANGATCATWDATNSRFSLPATYNFTGTAAGKFNMPMYAEGTTTNLIFKNLCGVLAITVPANTTEVKVKSENQLNGAFTIDASYNLTFQDAITTATQTITVTYPTSASTQTVYVPVPAGDYYCIVIECNNQSQTIKKNVAVTRNHIYPVTFTANTITSRGLAEATVSAGSSTKKYIAWVKMGNIKWAICNLGADSPEDYGKYYAWGEVTAYGEVPNAYPTTASGDWDGTSKNSGYEALVTNNTAKTGYSTSDYKWGDGQGGKNSNLLKYKSSTYASLERSDDAASVNWGWDETTGTGWRMPTKEELQALLKLSKTSYSTSKGKGWEIKENDNTMLLPFGGFKQNSTDLNAGYPYYWSCTGAPTFSGGYYAAWYIMGKDSSVEEGGGRNGAMSIRPVYEVGFKEDNEGYGKNNPDWTWE